MHPYIHSSINHNSWKLEATQMSILKEMDKRDEVYTCIEILFSLENTDISDTRYNMEETWKHYAKWHNTNIVWFQFYEVLRTVKIIETESRTVGTCLVVQWLRWPCNAGETGQFPVWERRPKMLWGSWLQTTTTEARVLWSPRDTTTESLCRNERSSMTQLRPGAAM